MGVYVAAVTAIEIEVRPATAGFAAKLDRALTPAVNSIKTKFEGASRDATKAFDRTGDQIADSLKNIDVDQAFDQITDGLGDAAGDAANILRREFDDVGDDVGRAVGDDIGDSLRRELSDAADTATRSFDGVADGIGDQFGRVRFADRLRTEARDAARTVTTQFANVRSTIADQFTDIRFANRLSEEARSAARKVTSAFDGVRNKIGDAFGDIPIVSKLGEQARDAARRVTSAFDGIGRKLEGSFEGVRFADRFREEARDAARKAVTAFDGVKGRIADVFRDAARLSGQALRDGFRQLGRVGIAAFAGLATATVGATTAFTDYDAGIREVFTLLGESPPTAVLDGIDAQVKSLATTYGVDLADAVTGAYDAISAGVDPSDTAGFQAFTDNAAKFAQAGATDFGTSVDLLTTSINAFGLEASETGRVADILFAGIKGGKTTADQLGASLFQVAPIAASTGVNLETTTAALASLTAQGVPTAQAATQIKAAFSELGKEGTKASTAFTDLTGVGFREFLAKGGSVQEGLDLLAASASESGLTVSDLFGSVEAGQAVLGLTGDQADRFAENLDNVANSAGATDAAFETMQGSLRATLDRLRQTFRVGLVNLGEQLEPIITPVLAGIADRLPSVFENITGLVTGAAEVIAPFVERAVAGLDTVLERVASFDVGELFGQVDTTGFAASVSEVREAFDGIDFAAIGDALTRIGGAVADLAPEFLTIGTAISSGGFQVLEDLAPVIAELAVVALPPLVGLVSKLAAGFTALTAAIPGEVLAGLVISFKAINTALAVNAALTAAGGLVGYLKNIKLVTAATRVWAGVQRLLNLSLLANPIGIAVAAVAALAAGIVIAYRNSETFRDIIGRVGDTLGPVIDAVKTIGSAFGDLFQGDFSGFGQKIADGFGDLGGALVDLGRAGLSKLQELFASGEAGRLGTALRDKIGDGLQALGGLLADAGRAALGVLSDFFTGEAGTSLGASLREKLLEGIGDLAGFIGDKIGELADNLPAILSTVGTALVGAGKALAGFLLDALSAALTGLGVPPETVDSIIGGLTKGLELAGQAIGVAFDVISTVVSVGIDVVSLIIKGAAALWDTGILQTIWDGLSAVWDVAFTIIKGVVSGAIDFIGGLISGAKAIWDTGLLQTVWDGISAVWEGVFNTLETIVGGVIDAVGGLISGAKDVWDTVSLGGIWDGLTDLWDGSFDLITGAVEGFIDTVGGIIGKASEVWGKAAEGISGFFGGLFGGGEDPSEQAAGALSGIAEALGGANFDVSSITNIWGEVTAAWSADLGELETLTVTAIATISATIAGAGASLDVSGLSDVWTRPAISWRRDLSDLASTVTTGIAVVAGAIRTAEGRWDTTNLATTWDGLARGWATSLTRLGTVVSTSVGNIAGIITGARAQWNVAQLATIWTPLNASWQAQLAGLAVTVAGGITRIAATISGAPAALNVASMESVFTSIAPSWAGSLATANGSVASGMATVGSTVIAALAQLRSQATAAMTGTVAAMIAPLLAAVGRFGAAARAAAAAILRPFRTLRAQLSGLLNGVSLGSINVGTVINQLNSVTNAANRASRAVSTATRNASQSRTVSRTSTRSTVQFRAFAQGGLADEPSIFGEDGPELALPFTKPQRMRVLLAQFSRRIAESVGGNDELQDLLFGRAASPVRTAASRATPPGSQTAVGLPQRLLPAATAPGFVASTPPRPAGTADNASPADREALAAAIAQAVKAAIAELDLGQTINVTTQPGRDLWADLALTDQRP